VEEKSVNILCLQKTLEYYSRFLSNHSSVVFAGGIAVSSAWVAASTEAVVI